MPSALPLQQNITVAGVDYRVRADHDPSLRPDLISFNTVERQRFAEGRWVFVTVTIRPIIDAVTISEQVHGLPYPLDPDKAGDLGELLDQPTVARAFAACHAWLLQIAAAITPAVERTGRIGLATSSPAGGTLSRALTPAQFAHAIPPLAGYRLAENAAALADLAPDGPAVLVYDSVFYDVSGRYAFILQHGFGLYSQNQLMLPPPWSGHSQPLPVAVADAEQVRDRLRQARHIAAGAVGIDVHAAARLMADLTALAGDLAIGPHEYRLVVDAAHATVAGLAGIAGRLTQHLYQNVTAREQLTRASGQLREVGGVLRHARAMLPDPARDRPIIEPRLSEVTLTGRAHAWTADAVIVDRYHPHRKEVIAGGPAPSPQLALRQTLRVAADTVPGYRAPTAQVPAIVHAPHDVHVDDLRLGTGFTTDPARRAYQLVAHFDGPIDPLDDAAAVYPAIVALATTNVVYAADCARRHRWRDRSAQSDHLPAVLRRRRRVPAPGPAPRRLLAAPRPDRRIGVAATT